MFDQIKALRWEKTWKGDVFIKGLMSCDAHKWKCNVMIPVDGIYSIKRLTNISFFVHVLFLKEWMKNVRMEMQLANSKTNEQ